MIAGMMKHIKVLTASAAALAASVALTASVPAAAQQYGQDRQYRDDGQLAGAPGYRDQDTPRLFPNQERDDWRNNGNDWRRSKPDFQTVQRACSRAGIQEAWNRNYYSAQYHDGPRLVEGRYGWEMRGKMRLHDRRGYSYVNTVCDMNRNGVARIEFLR